MAEMIQNEQELAQILPAEVPEQSLATVMEIAEDGVVLDIGEKHYKCSTGIVFKVGDRVKLIKDSGTYLVAFPIGAPITGLHAATADSATSATNATNAENATNAVNATSATNATNATNAENAEISEMAKSIRSPINSQKIQFNVSGGVLSYRVGSSSWVALQNA